MRSYLMRFQWQLKYCRRSAKWFTFVSTLRVATTVLLISCTCLGSETRNGAAADSRGLRLILLPSETSIKPGATVAFDVYLYNSGQTNREVASLELLSTVYTLDDITCKRLGRSGGTKSVSTDGSSKHVLKADSIEQTNIEVKVPAQPGDLVKLYVQLEGKPRLRSNSVVLFCPHENKQE